MHDCVSQHQTDVCTSFGNFVNRALKFVKSQYNGIIPETPDAPGPLSPNDKDDADFIADVNGLLQEYIANMERVRLRSGLQTVMSISSRGNLYLQSAGLNKALVESKPERCAQVIGRALNLIYVLSALVHPFMPDTADAILVQLNAPARSVPTALALDLLPGHVVGEPEHLFKRIEEKMADIWRDKFAGAKPAPGPDADATHVVPGMSKRKAAAAKKAATKATATPGADEGPKSAEVLSWEQRVAEQGQTVRDLKAKTPKTPELDAEIATAVDELKKLKLELADLVAKESKEA
jgi:methionyl-tRNA synthetase